MGNDKLEYCVMCLNIKTLAASTIVELPKSICNMHLSAFDTDTLLILYDLGHKQRHCIIHHLSEPQHFYHLQTYLNKYPDINYGNLNSNNFIGGTYVKSFSYKGGHGYKAYRWYDHEAVKIIRRLTLEKREQLKKMLNNMRDRRIRNGRQNPIKFLDKEIEFVTTLPKRIQENITSNCE